MNEDRAFERATRDWLEAGSDRTPAESIEAVLLAVRTTPQERDLRIPWRTPRMTTFKRAAVGLAAVVVVAVVAVLAIGRAPGPANPNATPSPSPSVEPTIDTTVWVGFTSAINGFTARYPTGWSATPATQPGSETDLINAKAGVFDDFQSKDVPPDDLIGVSSKLPAGTTQAAWIAAYRQPVVDKYGASCFPPPDQWQPVTISGHAGGLYLGCNYVESMTFVQDRVYIFTLAQPLGSAPNAASEALFRAFLATVVVHPETAVEPQSPVDTSGWLAFESQRDGYSIRHPVAWTVAAATAPWPYPPGADYPKGAIDEFLPAPPDPGDFVVTSQAIPAGVSDDAWFTAYIQDPFRNGCFPARAQWQSITIGGHAAGVHGDMTQCNFTEAVAIVGGRAYVFTATPNKTTISGVIYPRNLFDALLSTVVFEPQKANDTPAGG